MNSRQTATLMSIYANPTPGDIRWNQIVSLLKAVGAELDEGRSGSRVAIILSHRVSVVHRPHRVQKSGGTQSGIFGIF